MSGTHRIAEIVAIGSELTSGARLDTNSQWLSEQASDLGIVVRYHTTIADELEPIVDAFRRAVERADVVFVTGGLGPTLDDLTRDALAEAAGVPLLLHEASLEHVRRIFERRGRDMPERNRVQALFPAGSDPLENPTGTAPGIAMTFERPNRPPCLVAAMPGVPSEMKRMFRDRVLPRLGEGNLVIRRYRLKIFGQGESHTEALLGDLTARGREPEVGITVHEATITLRITAHGPDAPACDASIAATAAVARERLGELVYGEEDEELWDVVVRDLVARRETLATVESGTGGLLAHVLTDVPGFEAAYLGGLIVPTAAAKRALLELPEELLAPSRLVSAETAKALATACRARFGTTRALAITAWPGDDREDAAPQAHLALASLGPGGSDRCEVHAIRAAGDPSINKIRTAKSALDLLRRRLLRERSPHTDDTSTD